MLDGVMRRLIGPGLDRAGHKLAARGVAPDHLTLLGLLAGLAGAAVIAAGWPTGFALLPLLFGRLCDGLDGAIARARGLGGWGGLADIVADFVVYGAVPLAFVWRDGAANGAAGAFLLFTFYVNGATYLAFAAEAARAGMSTESRGRKTLFATAGLLEGTETIAFFAALCLWPDQFAPLAWAFGTLCLLTAAARVRLAHLTFRSPG